MSTYYFRNSITQLKEINLENEENEELTMTMNKTAIEVWNVQQNSRAKSSNGINKRKEGKKIFIYIY